MCFFLYEIICLVVIIDADRDKLPYIDFNNSFCTILLNQGVRGFHQKNFQVFSRLHIFPGFSRFSQKFPGFSRFFQVQYCTNEYGIKNAIFTSNRNMNTNYKIIN